MPVLPSHARVVLSVLLALTVTPAARAQAPAQSIFKCIDGGTTAYQSMPCGGEIEAQVMTIIARADPQLSAQSVPIPTANDSVSIPTAQSRGKMWPPRRTLMLGMSDDEVLNLPGWGVPKRITRSKATREWREEWIYPTTSGERRLYFVNATLVDAVVDPEGGHAAMQVAIERRTYPAT